MAEEVGAAPQGGRVAGQSKKQTVPVRTGSGHHLPVLTLSYDSITCLPSHKVLCPTSAGYNTKGGFTYCILTWHLHHYLDTGVLPVPRPVRDEMTEEQMLNLWTSRVGYRNAVGTCGWPKSRFFFI